jgi:hypothetical protein
VNNTYSFIKKIHCYGHFHFKEWIWKSSKRVRNQGVSFGVAGSSVDRHADHDPTLAEARDFVCGT